MLIALINQLLPAGLHQKTWEVCTSRNWYFGHHSGNDTAVQSFWKMDLEDSAVIDQAWEIARPKCEALINKPLKVVRQYANGHTYGLGGQPHQDDTNPGAYTLLYYPMLNWDALWDGETVYYKEDGEIEAAIKPAPNRAIFFDSRILHVGRAPSRYFGGLRVTVAYKLQTAETA